MTHITYHLFFVFAFIVLFVFMFVTARAAACLDQNSLKKKDVSSQWYFNADLMKVKQKK